MAQNFTGSGNRYRGGSYTDQGDNAAFGERYGRSRDERGAWTQADWPAGQRRQAYPSGYPDEPSDDLDQGRFQTRSRSALGEAAEHGLQGSYARSRNRGPKNWQRSDERIVDDICERLTRALDVDVSDVSVTVEQGTVTLTGTVEDRRAKHLIEDVADDCAGVRDVDNRLRVQAGESRDSRRGGFWQELFGFQAGARARDVMTRDVLTVAPHDTVQRAAEIMRDAGVGSVPVCDGRHLQGVITDRDIAIRAVALARPADQTRIVDVMTQGVFWCYEDDDIADVLEKMGDRQVRRIPVVNREKNLVGIVSLGDMATQRAGTQVETALEEISEPSQVRH